MSSCKQNILLNDAITVGIQVTLIFTFLTTFFFLYVIKIEKEEFGKQMDIIVDSVMDDLQGNIKDMINSHSTLSKDDMALIISGLIDVEKEKIAMDTKKSVKNVVEKNKEIEKKAYSILVTALLAMIIVSTGFIVLGFCIPLANNVKMSAIAVFFVALTELTFLKLISAQYISVDPYSVKRHLGEAVINWINKNKKD